jgi:alpha-L-fucosidase
MLARSLLTIAFGGCLLALFALPGAQAQSPTAPTASIDPEAIDAIWQKASSKYDVERAALLKQVDAVDHHGPLRADWESLQKYDALEWHKDAKVGIFVNWGVYSVPAFGNEWYPRSMYSLGSDEYKHHVATYGTQDKFGYKDFVPMFKAADFNAAAWAQLFKKIRRQICRTGGGASRWLRDV